MNNQYQTQESTTGANQHRDEKTSPDVALGKASKDLEDAKTEWDAVTTVIPVNVDIDGRSSEERHKQLDLINFNEALQFFQTCSMQEHKIVPILPRRGFKLFCQRLCGPPKLSKDLVDERNLIFTIAACPLDDTLPIHMRVLQTIYKQLTGDRFDCSRYGRHWEQIGFQGCDPATDLRGMGLWGLMNLLHMVTCPQTVALAKKIYKLSLHEVQNFPFVVMSINITAIVLQALREERLNRICNKRKQVVAVVNDYYIGVFLHLYLRWKNEHKTISQSGFILKDVELYAKKNPKSILDNLEKYEAFEKEATSSGNRRPSVSNISETPSRQLSNIDANNFSSLHGEFSGSKGHVDGKLDTDNEQKSMVYKWDQSVAHKEDEVFI